MAVMVFYVLCLSPDVTKRHGLLHYRISDGVLGVLMRVACFKILWT